MFPNQSRFINLKTLFKNLFSLRKGCTVNKSSCSPLKPFVVCEKVSLLCVSYKTVLFIPVHYNWCGPTRTVVTREKAVLVVWKVGECTDSFSKIFTIEFYSMKKVRNHFSKDIVKITNLFFLIADQVEMQRAPLDKIILDTKILDMGPPKELLALALDPPDLRNIKK